MEFRFNVEPFFNSKNVARVGNSLVPADFRGDRRTLLDTTSKFSEIINDMGEASARAQGLTRPVTTAQKLRNSDHTVYLMHEKGGKNGLVTGLLKVGRKQLYMFDDAGETHTVNAPCVLDFYVHESRQRFGLGKVLFEHMLDCEQYKANQLAVDRPSDKLLAFLRKHYGLERQIRQMNNFVIYDGFFDLNEDQNNNAMNVNSARLSNLHITNSPNTLLFGPQFYDPVTNVDPLNTSPKNIALMSSPGGGYDSALHSSPIGRYAAPRPMGHMAEIIHNDSMGASREHDRYGTVPQSRYHRSRNFFPAPASHYPPSVYMDTMADDDDMQPQNGRESLLVAPRPRRAVVEEDVAEEPVPEPPVVKEVQAATESSKTGDTVDTVVENVKRRPSPPSFLKTLGEELQLNEPIKLLQSPNQSFHYSKQHTGLKNLSFNVGAAVMPSAKMQFDQEQPESFGVVKLNRPTKNGLLRWEPHRIIGRRKGMRFDVPDPEKLMMSKSVENLTEQGYLDLKYYHNKLW